MQESDVGSLIDFLQEGRPVHTGVAIFTPSIDRHGNLKVNVRVDKRIMAALNAPDGFMGKIDNRNNIGMDTAGFVQLWNEEHPDDPVLPDGGVDA